MTGPVALRRRYVLLSALRWFPTGLVVPVLVLLLRARGLDLATIGVVVAVHSAAVVALELPTGGLADVVGRRPVLVVSALLSAVATLVLALGQSPAVLAAGAALLGAARALDSGPLQAWYVDAVHRLDPGADLRPGLARAEAAEGLALGLGALAGGALVAVVPLPATGAAAVPALAAPFLVSAALTAAGALAVLRWVTEPPRSSRAGTRDVLTDVPRTVVRGLGLAVRRGAVRRMVLLAACTGLVLAGVELLSPLSFAALLGGETAAAGPYGVLVTMAFLGTAGGSVLAPALARLLRSSAAAVAAALLLAAGAAVGIAAPALGVAAAAYVALYLLLGVASPLAADLTHRATPPSARATVLSVRSLALQGAGVVAALVVAPVAAATSFLVGFAVVAAALVAGALTVVKLPQAGLISHSQAVRPARSS